MSNEGLLILPYRGGFSADAALHAANLRTLEQWARNPKASWSLVELTALPSVADHVDGAQVFVADVLYVRSGGAWKAVAVAGGPFIGAYAPGSFLIPTEHFAVIVQHLKLASSSRATLEGTGRLVVSHG